MLGVGSQGLYQWLVTDKQFDLLQLCPEVVLGKYVAVTSIDSGALVPTQKEIVSGWRSQKKIAYSPRVEAVHDFPRAGWDEWYIFNDPTDLGESHLGGNIFELPQGRGHLSVFVNYGFAPHPPERSAGLAELFWQQMEWIQPESYVADNDYLTLVTSNNTLFTHVHESIKALGS